MTPTDVVKRRNRPAEKEIRLSISDGLVSVNGLNLRTRNNATYVFITDSRVNK